MRRAIAIIIILLLPGLAAAKRPQPVVDGERLEFRLIDLDGNSVDHDDARFRGKVLFVTAWATWCPPCLSEIPTLIDLQSRLGERGLIVVAVAFERGEEAGERRESLRDFARERDINYLVLDGGQPERFAEAFPNVDNVSGLPLVFVIDRDGRLVEARNGRGYRKRWARQLEQELMDLLTAPEPSEARAR